MQVQQIIMYVLIALGLFFLVAPQDLLQQYTPEFISSLESSTLMMVGAGCLAGAYFLYSRQGKVSKAPPAYEDSSIMTPSA
jgi:hypothetical protein